MSRCLERGSCMWARVKKGEHVYWTPNMHWVCMLSFNFHSLMKKILLFSCSKRNKGCVCVWDGWVGGLVIVQSHQSSNRNQVCPIPSPFLSIIIIWREKTKHRKGKSYIIFCARASSFVNGDNTSADLIELLWELNDILYTMLEHSKV